MYKANDMRGCGKYLARIRIDDSCVLHASGATHDNLLHVLPDNMEVVCFWVVVANFAKKFDYVAQ